MMCSKSFSLDPNELESMFDMLQSFSISKDVFDNMKLASFSKDNLQSESIDLDPLFSFMSTDEFQNSNGYNKENFEHKNNNTNSSTLFYSAPQAIQDNHIAMPKFLRPPTHNGGSNILNNNTMININDPSNFNNGIVYDSQDHANAFPMISLFSLYNLTRGIQDNYSVEEKNNDNISKHVSKIISEKLSNNNSNHNNDYKTDEKKKLSKSKIVDKNQEVEAIDKLDNNNIDTPKKLKSKKTKKLESPKKIGIYTLQERKIKIALYRKKRADRKSLLKYKYRKDLAEKRQRIGGRFAKVEKPTPLTTVVEEETEGENKKEEEL